MQKTIDKKPFLFVNARKNRNKRGIKNNRRPEYCILPKKVYFNIEFQGRRLVAEKYKIQQDQNMVLLKLPRRR